MFAQLRYFVYLALVLFNCAATAAVAAQTFTVTAEDFSFTPSALTINVGDSVMFKNGGGGHNVVADDGTFTSGAVSTSAWSITHTFNTAGTFRYYCKAHGGPGGIGMSGSVTVNAVQQSFNLGGYLSGNWFDPTPNQAGHGFQLEFTNAPGATPGNKVLVAIWFVFTPDGGPQWVYGQGEWSPNTNTATIPAEIYTGAKFPPNYNFNDRQQLTFPPGWGTLTFTFSGCNDGTAAWEASSIAAGMGYGSGTIPIKRLTQIDGTACPQ